MGFGWVAKNGFWINFARCALLSCITKPEEDDTTSEIYIDTLSAEDFTEFDATALNEYDFNDLFECDVTALSKCVGFV